MTEWHATPPQSKIFAAQGHRMPPAPAHASALRRAFGAFQLTCALSISLGSTLDGVGGRVNCHCYWDWDWALACPDCGSLSRRFAPSRNAKRPTLRIIECPCALIAQRTASSQARCFTAGAFSCSNPLQKALPHRVLE